MFSSVRQVRDLCKIILVVEVYLKLAQPESPGVIFSVLSTREVCVTLGATGGGRRRAQKTPGQMSSTTLSAGFHPLTVGRQ